MRLYGYIYVSADDSFGTYDETVCYDYAESAADFDALTDGEGGHGGWYTHATDITEVDEIPQEWIDEMTALRASQPYADPFVPPSPERPFSPQS